MTADQQIRKEIKNRIDRMPADRLKAIFEFIIKLEREEDNSHRVMAFAGIWKDWDSDIFDDLTIKLHQNRFLHDRQITI